MTTHAFRKRLPWIYGLLSVVMVGAFAVTARADDADVIQIRQTFEPNTLEVASGASVTFLNADDVNHNLHLVAPGGVQTDFGVDKPGESTKVAFGPPGAYTVICSVHPRMKLKVTVH